MTDIRILIISNSSFSIEAFRFSLIHSLLSNGFEVRVVAPADNYSQRVRDKGIELVSPSNFDYKNPLSLLKFFCICFYQIWKFRPHHIFSFTIVPNFISAFSSFFYDFKFSPNITGRGAGFRIDTRFTRLRAYCLRRLYKLLFKNVNTMFVQNKEDSQFFIRHGIIDPSRCIILPGSGVNLEKYTYQGNKRITDFLFAGRLSPEKGIFDFLVAFHKAATNNPNLAAIVIGAIPDGLKSSLRAKLRDLLNQPNVHYLGHVFEVANYMSEAKWLVLPSYYHEGTPKTLLEGAALQMGIITTDWPGCRDLVEEGKNGFLVPPKNPDFLASTLAHVSKFNDKEFERIGRRSRSLVEERYSDSVVIQKYLDQIRSCE